MWWTDRCGLLPGQCSPAVLLPPSHPSQTNPPPFSPEKGSSGRPQSTVLYYSRPLHTATTWTFGVLSRLGAPPELKKGARHEAQAPGSLFSTPSSTEVYNLSTIAETWDEGGRPLERDPLRHTRAHHQEGRRDGDPQPPKSLSDGDKVDADDDDADWRCARVSPHCAAQTIRTRPFKVM